MIDFIYGTAWKKEKTENLTTLALKAGFRAIDTANQAKHYNEVLVGKALKEFISNNPISREDVWIQSKFTSIDGQDNNLPYNKNANLTTQVMQSFESSLEHLNTSYLDSYLLHGPVNYPLLGEEDFEIWSAIESLYKDKKANNIGISNFNLKQLKILLEQANIKPKFLQNRCFAYSGWDKDIRKLCKDNNIIYQGFSLLTANIHVLKLPNIIEIANKYNTNTTQIIFRFAQQIGIIPLTGTSNKNNMINNLEIDRFKLTSEEIGYIENCSYS